MFSGHITPVKFKKATITGNFGFVFEKTRTLKEHYYRNIIALDNPD